MGDELRMTEATGPAVTGAPVVPSADRRPWTGENTIAGRDRFVALTGHDRRYPEVPT